MPQAVSRRQYRMMMAILHGKAKDGPRGRPPKSVAAKYTDPGKDSPEQSGEDRGGSWGEKHHAKAKDKVKEERTKRKKSKKDLKKSFEDYLAKGEKHREKRCAAVLVMDSQNRILLGEHNKGGLAFPGGHCHPNEPFEIAALREAMEETGTQIRVSTEIWHGKTNGNETSVWLGEVVSGKPKNTKSDSGKESMTDWKWHEMDKMPWHQLRDCCIEPIRDFVTERFGKSLKGMLAIEILEKNIIRQRGDAVLEVTHGDALRLIGNGLFRRVRESVLGMGDEDFKDVHLDNYTVSIRKHMNDVYSGRVSDGHKIVYQFTNKSLPELTVALMSVFEWYLPEDEADLDLLDEGALPDDAIEGGINELVENYKRHNIGNIYAEMETIRSQIRHGMAVDLQQVEARIMSLFDKLEECVQDIVGKHNHLAQQAGGELDELERKLRELQSKIEEMEKKPETVEAYSSNPADKEAVHSDHYSYLSKPRIEIEPTGKIIINFSSDWQHLEKENFLRDMRAKVIKKASK